MGTTSDKLTYLNETKTLLKNKINLTGANITTDTFRQYPTKLQNALLECWNNEGEPIFTNWGNKITSEGTNVKLDNTLNARMKITPKGNTSQTGTPTPSSPIPVNTVNGDNYINIANSDSSESQTFNITLCGKNLYDINNNPIIAKVGYNASGEPRTWSDYVGINTYVKVAANTTYTLTSSLNKAMAVVIYYDDNKTILSTSTNVSTFTTPNNTKYIRFCYYEVGETIPTWVQLEKSSTSTSYEAYSTIELCKIGDYQDYFFKNGDKWYLHKEIGKYVANNDLTNNGSTSTLINLLTPALNIEANISTPEAFTDKTLSNLMGLGFGSNQGLGGTTSSSKIRVNLSKDYASDTSTANTFLKNNNFTIYYVLATPTEEEITNTTLINQLEALKGAMSYEGQTNISSGFMIVGASALGN